MAELKRNSDWHYANQGSLVSKLDGKLIAIIDCAVVGECQNQTILRFAHSGNHEPAS